MSICFSFPQKLSLSIFLAYPSLNRVKKYIKNKKLQFNNKHLGVKRILVKNIVF